MKKRKTKWIVLAVVLIVAVAGYLLLNGSKAVRYAEVTASSGNITTYYSFSGNLDVNNAVTLTAPAEATVSEIYVTANSSVSKNARLMRLSDGTILKADIAGEVTSLDVTTDAVVKAGQTLAEIMDLTSMKVTFKVDEYDVSAVSLGKTAQITVDGTGNTFEGKITGINKRATVSGDLSYYIATVDLKGQTMPAEALPGMQITAKVLNHQAENVVLLPIDVVDFNTENAPYVLMRDGDTVKEIGIEVGINDGTNVEITHGLKAGETVLYTPTSTSALQNMRTMRSDMRSTGVVE